MVGLLDINVLVALAWPNHEAHGAALMWFQENQELGWATCPVTQSGFVRVSSNNKILPDARTPAEALSLLDKITALEHHVFWADNVSLVDPTLVSRTRLRGYRQVTDAHLLAIALNHGGRMVSFDKGFLSLVPDGFVASDVIALIGSS